MQKISFIRVKRGIKSTLSVLLCIALVLAMSYRKPVKTEAAATATVVTVAGAVAVAAALSTMGIMASVNHKTYAQECGDIWNNITTDVKNQITLTGLSVHEGLATLALTPAFLKAVFTQAQTEFSQATSNTITGNFTNLQFENVTGIPDYLLPYIPFTFEQCSNLRFYGTWVPSAYTFISTSTSMVMPFTGLNIYQASSIDRYNYYDGTTVNRNFFSANYWRLGTGTSDNWGTFVSVIHTCWATGNTLSSYEFPVGSHFKVYSLFYSGITYLFFTSVDIDTGLTYYFNVSGDVGTIPLYGQDVFNPADKDLYADGYSTMLHDIDDVINKLKEKIGAIDGSIPVSVPADSDIDRQQTRDQTDTTGKDIASDEDKTSDKTYNNDRDTTVPKSDDTPDLSIPDLMYNKFPFCLPWDMYNSIKVLAATPTPPKFTVPFLKISAWNIDQSVTIDTSQFSSVATTTRWGFSVLWVLGLIFATRKLIWK